MIMWRRSAPKTRWLVVAAGLVILLVGARVVFAQAPSAGPLAGVSISSASAMINEGNFIDGPDAAKFSWVPMGWTVMRQLSNIMVFVFLFIASVATTLNLQVGTYGIKRMLPSVVTATVLANMSREITNILLSVEFSIRNGLMSLVSGGGGSLWGNLAAPIQAALTAVHPQAKLGDVITAFLYLLFATVGVIALLLLVLLFYVRKIFLGFLIILAPLAFLAMAAPFSQGVFKKWWSEYAKWMFMPTVSTFFIAVGAVIVFAVGAAGSFSLIAFIAALGSIYLAIKVPFGMGGMVGAAAGFIAGNTWGRTKGAIGEHAQTLAFRTPGIGHGLRYLERSRENRQATLAGLKKRPVATSTRLADQRTMNDPNATPQERQEANRRLNSRWHQFRNWAAENFERSTIVAGNQGAQAEAMAKDNRAASLDRYSRAGARGGQLNRELRQTEITAIEAAAAEKALMAAGLTTGLAARKIFAEVEEQQAGTQEKHAGNAAMGVDPRLAQQKREAGVADLEATTAEKALLAAGLTPGMAGRQREAEVTGIEVDAAEKLALAAGLTRNMAARKLGAESVTLEAGTEEKRRQEEAMGSPALVRQMAAAKLDDEMRDSEIERLRLEGEDAHRQDPTSLSHDLADSQEQVAALKDRIEGFTNTMKASVLSVEGNTRAMRRQATLMKEIGSLGYAEQLADIKEQIRETDSTVNTTGVWSNDITRQLETDPALQRQLSLLLQPGYGDQGSLMKSALVRLGGRKAMFEETVASMEKQERALYQGSLISGISSMHGALGELRDPAGNGFNDLKDHTMDEATFNARFNDFETAAGAAGDTRISRAIEELGIAHLSVPEQRAHLYQYLGAGRKDLRSVSLINGVKAMGEIEQGQRSFMMKDASFDTVVSNLRGDTANTAPSGTPSNSKAAQALRLMAAGGAHTRTGAAVYATMGGSNRERQEALNSVNKGLARVHGSVQRVLTLRDDATLATALGAGPDSWVSQVSQLAEDVTGTPIDRNTPIGAGTNVSYVDASGTTGPLTVDIAHQILTGAAAGVKVRVGNRQANPEQTRAAIQNALRSTFAPILRLDASVVDNTGNPAA